MKTDLTMINTALPTAVGRKRAAFAIKRKTRLERLNRQIVKAASVAASVVLALFALSSAQLASAATCNYIGANNGEYASPTNWDCGTIPGVSDIATITGFTVALSITGPAYNVSALNLSNANFTIANNAQLNVGGLTTFFANSTLTNAGKLTTAGNFNIPGGSSFLNATTGKYKTAATSISLTGAFTNDGEFEVDANQTFTLATPGLFTQTVNGVLKGAGTLSASGALALNGGRVVGNLTIAGDVFNNNATISPGDDGVIGTIKINGNYVQTQAGPNQGTLRIDIAGVSMPGLIDRFEVFGTTVILNGSANFDYIGGYVPAFNDNSQFMFVPNATLTGTFSGSGYPSDSRQPNLSYFSSGVTWVAGSTVSLVTNLADGLASPPVGSLRAALLKAQDCSKAPYDIGIAVAGTSAIVAPLPTITCNSFRINGANTPGHMDNTSQTDWNGITPFILDGSGCNGCTGLTYQDTVGGGNPGEINGLQFQNWATAIDFKPTGALDVYGNYFTNNGVGIRVGSAAGVGNTGSSQRNVFVNNTTGISVDTMNISFFITNNVIGLGTGGAAGGNTTGVLVVNALGGIQDVTANIFANNQKGLVIGNSLSDTSRGVNFRDSTFFNNAIIAVDLGNQASGLNAPPIANDLNDVDTGPNGLVNYPSVGSISDAGANLTVAYTYQGLASTSLDVYVCGTNSLTVNECKQIGAASLAVSTDAAGNAAGNISVPKTGLFASSVRVNMFVCVNPAFIAEANNCSEISPGVNFSAGSLTVSPASLTFATTPINWQRRASGLPDFISVTNTTANPVNVTSRGGSTSDIFWGGAISVPAGCLTQIPAMQTCSYEVLFRPSTVGTIMASLTIVTNLGTLTIPVTGTGATAVPTPVITPDPLNFPSTAIGNTTPGTFTFTNPVGGVAIDATSITTPFNDGTQGFSVGSTTCTGMIMPGAAACAITVNFAPTGVPGVRADSMFVISSPASPYTSSYYAQSIPVLNGTATVAVGPVFSPSATTFTFGNVGVGETSTAQILTITNSGSSVMTIGAIPALVAFTKTTTCSTSLLAGNSCTITFKAAPTALGVVNETLSITTNAPGSPHIISLGATGVVPAFTITPSPINHGNVTVSSSSTVNASFTNNSSTTFTLGSTGGGITNLVWSPGGAAPCANASPLLPGASCTLASNYTAFSATTTNTTLNLNFFSGGTPFTASVMASGTGVAPLPTTMTVAVSPGAVAQNTNATVTLTLGNPNAGIANITSGNVLMPTNLIVQTGPAPTNTCGTSTNIITGGTGIGFVMGTIPGSGNCTITFSVRSANAGAYIINVPASALTTSFGANTNTSNASLNVVPPVAPGATLSLTNLNFGAVGIGQSSATQRTVVTSSGQLPLIISSIQAVGDFSYISDCPLAPASLVVGDTCNVDVNFNPLSVGNATAFLYVNSNAPFTPAIVVLNGTGANLPKPILSVGLPNIDFGDRAINTTSPITSILVSNQGPGLLVFGNIVVAGAGITRSPTANPSFTAVVGLVPSCGTTQLALSQNCHISLIFAPTVLGRVAGSVTIVHNAGTVTVPNPFVITVAGNGTNPAPVIRLSADLSFVDTVIGSISGSQAINIDNIGTAPLSVSSLVLNPTNPNTFINDFTIGGTCPGTIAPNGRCTLSVAFTPRLTTSTAQPAKAAALTIGSDASNAATVNRVRLQGIALPLPAPVVNLDATTLGFGNTILNSTSVTQRVTLTNIGGLSMTIGGIATTAGFFQTNTCGATLAPNASCVINLRYAPRLLGTISGMLTITTNAASSPDRLALTGQGCRLLPPSTGRFVVSNCGN